MAQGRLMLDRQEDQGFLGVPAWLWSVAALCIGLGLSLFAAWNQHASLASAERVLRERQADRAYQGVRLQLDNCALLVRSVQTLFLSSQEVTPEEFQNVYVNLRPRVLFPSLQAIAFARREPGGAGMPDSFVTRLVAPSKGNEALLGLDIRTQPANLRGLEISRDSDQPAMSGAFKLIQRAGARERSDGIVIRLPVFTPGPPPRDLAERRQRFTGSVAASFQVRSLIQRALPREEGQRMEINVADVSDATARDLYRSAPSGAEASIARFNYRFKRDIRFGGRTWRMEFIGHPEGSQLIRQPALTLLGGAIASLLLAALAWSTANTRNHARILAHRMSVRYRESEARFRALNELLPTLVLLARLDGALVYANQAARSRLALSHPGQAPQSLSEVFEDPGLRDQIDRAAQGDDSLRNVSVRCAGEGYAPFWATLSVSRIDLDGSPHLLAVANDITELRDLNEMLSYQAAHDPLTGLVNRREFGRRLDLAIEGINAGGSPSALLYFDLDQFKIINDTSGHNVGDQLLSQLAALLGSHLVDGETIARLGGDEFGILLEPASRERAMEFAERMRLEIDGFVFSSEQRTYAVSVSVGLILLDRPGLSQREVLSLADTACYMAKERGRNRVYLYSEKDAETTRRRSEMEWASRLRQALLDDRFILHFQELSELHPGGEPEGVHMEMLLRLRDEDGSMVPPGAFIPAAERFGLMLQLDRWVVETTLANFSRLHPSGQPVHLCAINLSALTVEDDTFPQFVLERLERYGVAPGRVCFEITETAAVASMVRVVELMNSLRRVGCRFSLDDFGAGMASFGYLKNLPVDYVKIDGSFIRNIETDPISFSIVRAVTDIGHQLGLKVVAEWVTDERAMEILRGAGVDYAQGYFLHKPETAVCFR
jgi:diguanylate cyclase (GGDEF)-like protein/PAS domain S-box-containing protein